MKGRKENHLKLAKRERIIIIIW